MAVSNWYLYVGIFLCCSGFLLPLGVFYIVWWFWNRHEDMEKAKLEFMHDNSSKNTNGSTGGFGGTNSTSDEDTPRDYVSKETLEENR